MAPGITSLHPDKYVKETDSVFSIVYTCCLCSKRTNFNVLLEEHEARFKYTYIVLDGLEEWPAVQVCNQCAALYEVVPYTFERRIKWLRLKRWYLTSFWAQFASCVAFAAFITNITTMVILNFAGN